MTNRAVIEHEAQPDLTGPADPYRRLGVDRDATAAQIKRAWRKLAHKFHPDKGGDRKIFDELMLCYETLIDPERRRHYDLTGTLKEKAPDTLASDAMSLIVNGFEMVLMDLAKTQTEPRHVDIVARIKVKLETMSGERYKEAAQIKAALPEWKAVAGRFKRRGGDNFIARHIENKLGEFSKRLDNIERHNRAHKIAVKIIGEFSFDWEQPDRYEDNLWRIESAMARGSNFQFGGHFS